ncbi:hypothetical protein [Haloplanus aerogenes]|uniref:Uncharacterized protein n=1 Tax=Haloplanus aerogenes TaxID=660522 RepID=A0A3M0CY37_9EURY|nr:hypothetical protein [Haloplanus aerogenes]AZH23871.1 hypothetical protein DU502_00115 [Haloplanus aerogenes]RMB13370.1 hypothetical protein ATH50_2703 [Haloplanus aerogenes]
MDSRKLTLLVAVGLVCLPAPLYLSWAGQATAPPPKTSQIYVAEPLDPTNESDRDAIVEQYRTTVALSVHQVSERYSAGEYRTPNATRAALTAAMETGQSRATDAGTKADLRAIARNETFVYDAYGDHERYYRLRVVENGSVVRAENVSRDRVAAAILDEHVYRYDRLSPGAQRTVDRILDNSSADGDGYRPRVNDPFVDRLPALVEKDERLYSLTVYGHVDDFGPGFTWFVRGLLVTGVGVLLLLVAGGRYAYGWWRGQSVE